MQTYDRAEIVEDRNSEKLRVYLFSGDKQELHIVRDLRWDYADVDIDEIREEITERYGIHPGQISKRVEGSRSRAPTQKRKAREDRRRGPSR